jgi:hypothetical protein
MSRSAACSSVGFHKEWNEDDEEDDDDDEKKKTARGWTVGGCSRVPFFKKGPAHRKTLCLAEEAIIF